MNTVKSADLCVFYLIMFFVSTSNDFLTGLEIYKIVSFYILSLLTFWVSFIMYHFSWVIKIIIYFFIFSLLLIIIIIFKFLFSFWNLLKNILLYFKYLFFSLLIFYLLENPFFSVSTNKSFFSLYLCKIGASHHLKVTSIRIS